jgi:uncharacterized repeat protein (TIGR01451 family)
MRLLGVLALPTLGIAIAYAGPAVADLPPRADLAITNTAPRYPVHQGTYLSFSLQLTNAGPDNASAVTLRDAIPDHTTFYSLDQTSGPALTCATPSSGDTGIITCAAIDFPLSAVAAFTLWVRVDTDAAVGSTITNTVDVLAATPDPYSGNNSAAAAREVSAVAADLAVTISDSPDPVTPGGTLTYYITVVNNGPDRAMAVTLTDEVPANTTFVSVCCSRSRPTTPPVGGTGTVTIGVGVLQYLEGYTYTLVVNVEPGTTPGTVISDTATVSTSTNDPDLTNDSATATTDVVAAP